MHVDPLRRPWWLLPLGRISSLWWLPIAAGLIALTYIAGPDTPFPMLYALPVLLAGWYSGPRAAGLLGAAVPIARLFFFLEVWPPVGEAWFAVAMTIARGAFIALVGVWFARFAEHERAVDRHVQQLEGLLPICAFCKSIRNGKGDWEPLEDFISTRSDASFSHGFCPPCGREHYPDVSLE